ncbi:hypothetical protein C483_07257 [Natrialba hulunbeirensis JCM 10989]|uniref:DUF1211 domain-containing protein n=1 Tax=Natrialba hulunbeirensis JCM 10989 TaxID=1227493 RepID=M0A346_9EURY|nr:TMEM175 family protein [Natrialba hulunbeirensis]ELY92746.1 hypothetical protein C483_07257 [Natrialba hulunbeirensis JCM 10989]
MIDSLGGEGTDRMEGLSDGLFAIVLTLLVLQFEVPDVSAGELPGAIADQETLLFSYLLSYLVVGVYWIVHHNLFRNIVDHDRILLWLNLLFLLSISFLPYPTEIMGLYGTQFAWVLYATNIILVGTFLTLVWSYAARSGFVADEIDDWTARLVTVRGLIAPAVFVLSIGVSLVNISIAFFVPILIAPLQWLWVWYYRANRSD